VAERDPAGVTIPEPLQVTVPAWFGERGRAWLEALPEVVEGLAERWRLTVGLPYSGGSHSLVTAVVRADGSPAVLKVPILDEENLHEADALRHYAGEGAVQPYDADPETGALLLEQLVPGTALSHLADRDQAISVACHVLRRLWKPPAPDHRFSFVRDLAARWAERILADHDRCGKSFPATLIDQAAGLARDFADREGNGDGEESVVVNRDAHLGNILAAEREPWLLIDPKPLVGPPVFDAGYLLLDLLGDHPTPAAAHQLIDTLTERLGVSSADVRGWALLRAVENALWSREVGTDPAPHLTKAAALA
jgi:streptomycin 6-kinase